MIDCYPKPEVGIMKFLITGFPSPWRYIRRLYWRWVFSKTGSTDQYIAEFYKIDPDSLIKKGEL